MKSIFQQAAREVMNNCVRREPAPQGLPLVIGEIRANGSGYSGLRQPAKMLMKMKAQIETPIPRKAKLAT
ncbi:MAG: hypothetical protein Q8J78_02880, partial [Moraxellaceae bacterium]|nr:hypothetical protein [Moraxellaceae bacterium]